MKPVIIRDANFKVVSVSKNLRGIITRLGRIEPARFDIWPNARDGGAQLGVTWVDGSSVITDFADAGICRRWVEKRTRGAPVTVHEPKEK
jgi:hypothetical protein